MLTIKPVNYGKNIELYADGKNPVVFQRRLTEVFKKYANVDPFFPRRQALGYTFHSPVCPRYQHKNSKQSLSCQTPMSDLS